MRPSVDTRAPKRADGRRCRMSPVPQGGEHYFLSSQACQWFGLVFPARSKLSNGENWFALHSLPRFPTDPKEFFTVILSRFLGEMKLTKFSHYL